MREQSHLFDFVLIGNQGSVTPAGISQLQYSVLQPIAMHIAGILRTRIGGYKYKLIDQLHAHHGWLSSKEFVENKFNKKSKSQNLPKFAKIIV